MRIIFLLMLVALVAVEARLWILWTRLRHVEEALYIQPSDAFKEKEED